MSTFDGVVIGALTGEPILLDQLWYWVGQRAPRNASASDLAPHVQAIVNDRLNEVDWVAVTTALLTEPTAPLPPDGAQQIAMDMEMAMTYVVSFRSTQEVRVNLPRGLWETLGAPLGLTVTIEAVTR